MSSDVPRQNRTVRVHMMGGLGNQLFIFFTGLAYAKSTSRKLLVDKTEGGRGKLYWDTIFARSLQKDDIQVVPDQNFPKAFKSHVEKWFIFSPIPTFDDCDHVYLQGYFQCFKYFDSLQPELLSLLSAPSSYNDKLCHAWTDVLGLKPEDKIRAVSVHVRRGDYVALPNYHPLATTAYYLATSGSFEKGTLFVIFSDDLVWCRNNIFSLISEEHHDNIVFVPDDLDEIETFYFMSHYCERAHVIANSSFSWWIALLAWLRSERSMRVVAPHPWFGPRGPPRYETIYNVGWEIRNVQGRICDCFGKPKQT